MASPKSNQPKSPQDARHASPPKRGLLDQILPPDPRPPERPTTPPPNCGTLPPKLTSLGDLLGGSGRGWPF